MSQSLSRNIQHIVFSTKERRPFLKGPEDRDRLYAYIAGVLRNMKCDAIEINGVEDHIHILCVQHRTKCVADIVEQVKKTSSAWMKEQGPQYRDFYWQGGYGDFSVSESLVPKVSQYIHNQEEHHRKISFQDEFRVLCRKHKLEFDERYCWE